MTDATDQDDAQQLAAVAGLARNTIDHTVTLPARGFALTETDTGEKPTTGADVAVQLTTCTRPDGSAFVQLSVMSTDQAQLYGGAQVEMTDVQSAVMGMLGAVGPLGGV